MNRSQNVLRGRLAAATRHNPEAAPGLRAALKTSRAEDYIRNLRTDPLPSESELCRLAFILIGDIK